MSRRWKWFLWPGWAGADLVGRGVPDGDGSGRWRRAGALEGVPDASGASRGDGAVGEARVVRRVGVARNQRAGRYDPLPSGRCRGSVPGAGRRGDG